MITYIENTTKPKGKSLELIRQFNKTDRYKIIVLVVNCCVTN